MHKRLIGWKKCNIYIQKKMTFMRWYLVKTCSLWKFEWNNLWSIYLSCNAHQVWTSKASVFLCIFCACKQIKCSLFVITFWYSTWFKMYSLISSHMFCEVFFVLFPKFPCVPSIHSFLLSHMLCQMFLMSCSHNFHVYPQIFYFILSHSFSTCYCELQK